MKKIRNNKLLVCFILIFSFTHFGLTAFGDEILNPSDLGPEIEKKLDCPGMDTQQHYSFDFDELVWSETRDLIDGHRQYFLEQLERNNVRIVEDDSSVFSKDLLAYLFVFFYEMELEQEFNLYAGDQPSADLVKKHPKDENGYIFATNASIGLFNREMRIETEKVRQDPSLLNDAGVRRVQIAYNNLLLQQLLKLFDNQKIYSFFARNFSVCIEYTGEGQQLHKQDYALPMERQYIDRIVDTVLDMPYVVLDNIAVERLFYAKNNSSSASVGAYYVPSRRYVAMYPYGYKWEDESRFSYMINGDFVFAHELGHGLDYGQPKNIKTEFMKFSWNSDGTRKPEVSNFVRPYAGTSPAEDYAEAVAGFMYGPSDLNKVAPEKYAFVQSKVYRGVSYSGQSPDDFSLVVGGVKDREPPYLSVHPKQALNLSYELDPDDPSKATLQVSIEGASDRDSGVDKIELWLRSKTEGVLPEFKLDSFDLTDPETNTFSKVFDIDLSKVRQSTYIPSLRLTDKEGNFRSYGEEFEAINLYGTRKKLDTTAPEFKKSPSSSVSIAKGESNDRFLTLLIGVNEVIDDETEIQQVNLIPVTRINGQAVEAPPIIITEEFIVNNGGDGTSFYKEVSIDLLNYFPSKYQFVIELVNKESLSRKIKRDLIVLEIPGLQEIPDVDPPIIEGSLKPSEVIDLKVVKTDEGSAKLRVNIRNIIDQKNTVESIKLEPVARINNEWVASRELIIDEKSMVERGKYEDVFTIDLNQFYNETYYFKVTLRDSKGNEKVFSKTGDLPTLKIEGLRKKRDITPPSLVYSTQKSTGVSIKVDENDETKAKLEIKISNVLEKESEIEYVKVIPVSIIDGKQYRAEDIILDKTHQSVVDKEKGVFDFQMSLVIDLNKFFESDYYLALELKDSAGQRRVYDRDLRVISIPGKRNLKKKPPTKEERKPIPKDDGSPDGKPQGPDEKKKDSVEFNIDWFDSSGSKMEDVRKNYTTYQTSLSVKPIDKISYINLIWKDRQNDFSFSHKIGSKSAAFTKTQDTKIKIVLEVPPGVPSGKYVLEKVEINNIQNDDHIAPEPHTIFIEHESEFDVSSPWEIEDGIERSFDPSSNMLEFDVPLSGIENPQDATGEMTLRYPDGSIGRSKVDIQEGVDGSVRGVARFPKKGDGHYGLHSLNIQEGWELDKNAEEAKPNVAKPKVERPPAKLKKPLEFKQKHREVEITDEQKLF